MAGSGLESAVVMGRSIAWAGGHALRRAGGRQRNALMASLAANLALNAAWNWVFFGLRSPRGQDWPERCCWTSATPG